MSLLSKDLVEEKSLKVRNKAKLAAMQAPQLALAIRAFNLVQTKATCSRMGMLEENQVGATKVGPRGMVT
jgi:hypothetical protein